MRDQPPSAAACRTSNNRFEPTRWRQQHAIRDSRWMLRIVQGNRLTVHGDNLEGFSLELEVQIAIRRSVCNSPELLLSMRNLNLRPHGPVHRHDLVRRLVFATASLRTEVNSVRQIGRLGIFLKG